MKNSVRIENCDSLVGESQPRMIERKIKCKTFNQQSASKLEPKNSKTFYTTTWLFNVNQSCFGPLLSNGRVNDFCCLNFSPADLDETFLVFALALTI